LRQLRPDDSIRQGSVGPHDGWAHDVGGDRRGTNSRMKDFFDIAWLAEKFAFNDAPLRTAITATFARRRTSLPEGMPLALTVEFYGDDAKQQQWKGFLRRVNLPSETLATVVGRIANFLAPFVNKTHMHRHWPCGGPWGDNLP
jgi:hypothetical protein